LVDARLILHGLVFRPGAEMRRLGLAILCSALTVVVSSCNVFDGEQDRTYRTEVSLGRTLALTPRRLPTNGDPASHACVRGDYTHVYQTSQGMSGDREVWLCCIPVEEILGDSFRCADSPFPALFGGTDYAKIRYCSLAHPTSTEPSYIPVCIPAPLQAPGLDE
jgi:hypothetical protein